MLNFINSWDLAAVQCLNAAVGVNPIRDALILFFAVYLIYPFVLITALYWFVNDDKLRARKAIFLAFISFIISRFFLAELIRALWHRTGPLLQNQSHVLINRGSEASFPSGHASAMFAIAASIYFYNRRLGLTLFAMAAVTGLFRVIIGVHYPSDIIGGLIVGTAVAYIFQQFAGRQWVNRSLKNLSDFSDKLLPFTKRGK